LPEVSEQGQAQGGSNNTIVLSIDAQNENNHYKDLFVKIIQGAGQGQTRKIVSYDGLSKTATIDYNWTASPDITSVYKIDSSFYYIRYYQDTNNNISREITTCCFSEDHLTCVLPETYVSCQALPPQGQTLLETALEQARVIGEYVSDLEFYGARVINIFMGLALKSETMQLETKVFGRNL
jgi:hypothetical protein